GLRAGRGAALLPLRTGSWPQNRPRTPTLLPSGPRRETPFGLHAPREPAPPPPPNAKAPRVRGCWCRRRRRCHRHRRRIAGAGFSDCYPARTRATSSPSRDVARPAEDNAIRRDPNRVVRCSAAVEVRSPVGLGRWIVAGRQLAGTLGLTEEVLERPAVLLDARRGTRHLDAPPVGRKFGEGDPARIIADD